MKTLKARSESKKKKAESLKYYLSDILGGDRFESARNKISWRRSDEVSITDAAKIPSEYTTVKTEVSINKANIKIAIKTGAVVEGAELVYKNNIQIK